MGPQNCHLPTFHGTNCPSSASDPQSSQFYKSRSTLPDQHGLARVRFLAPLLAVTLHSRPGWLALRRCFVSILVEKNHSHPHPVLYFVLTHRIQA